MMLNFEDCFSTSIETIIFHLFIVGVLWNRMLIFVSSLFFPNIIVKIINFKITTKFLIFSLIVFTDIIFWSMQVQFMPGTGKDSQTPRNPFYEKFSHCESKSFDERSWYPSFADIFSTRNFQKQKRPPHNIFLTHKKFLTSFREISF